MSETDLATLVAWVDGGAIAGDKKHAPAPVEWPADGWQIPPDVVNAPEIRRGKK